MVGDILLLISGSLEDGVEGVVTNNLSERLEGNGLNGVLNVGWVNLQADGLDLIDWHLGGLSLGIEWVSLGGNEVGVSCSGHLVLSVVLVVLLVVLLTL